MVYDKQTLYKWHANNLVSPSERTSEADKKPVGDFHFFNNQWILINRNLPDMMDVTEKKPIAIGEYVPLTEGRQILLDKGQGGRLIVVQLVNNQNDNSHLLNYEAIDIKQNEKINRSANWYCINFIRHVDKR